MVKFSHIAELKRQPIVKKARTTMFPSGFPTPMGKQMAQPMKFRKLRFPSPGRTKKNARSF